MRRPRRIEFAGGGYYVTSRGNGQAPMLLFDDDRGLSAADEGATGAAARRRYRAYTHACVLENDRPILDAMRASRYAVGDEAFVRETEKRLQAQRTGRVQDRDVAWPVVTVDIGVIDAQVAAQYGIEATELAEHGHRAGAAKFVAVELACRLTGLTQRGVGAHYGGIRSAAVSTIRRKIREGQSDIAAEVEQVLAKIRNLEHRPKLRAGHKTAVASIPAWGFCTSPVVL